MKKRLLMFMIAGLVTATVGAQAQQPPTAESKSTIKPCIVVLGVRTPTRFEIRRDVRLLEVLLLAGGLTEHTQGTVEVVHTDSPCFESDSWPPRREQGSRDTYKVSEVLRAEASANPYLRSGDVVSAVEFDPIFVIGNVRTQREIVLKEQLTLTKAIAMAGGIRSEDWSGWVWIYRMKDGKVGTERLRYDLRAIEKGRIPDPILQPYDIVDVPRKSGHGDVLIGKGQPPKLPTRIIE